MRFREIPNLAQTHHVTAERGQRFGGKTYVFEGLSVFRSKGCIVGVVVEGVEDVCKLQ